MLVITIQVGRTDYLPSSTDPAIFTATYASAGGGGGGGGGASVGTGGAGAVGDETSVSEATRRAVGMYYSVHPLQVP